MKSLDAVPADLQVGRAVFRLEFPKHNPRFLEVDPKKMLELINKGVAHFKDNHYSVRVYPKVVVIKLVEPEAGHGSAKFDREEFLSSLKSV